MKCLSRVFLSVSSFPRRYLMAYIWSEGMRSCRLDVDATVPVSTPGDAGSSVGGVRAKAPSLLPQM